MGRPDTGSFGRSGSFVVFEAWNGSQGLASAPFLKRVFHRRSALAERGRPQVRAVCPQEEASVVSRETSTNDTGYVVRTAADLAERSESFQDDTTPLARAVEHSVRARSQALRTDGMQRPERTRVMVVANQKGGRSEEHTSELQSLMRISYAVCCLK